MMVVLAIALLCDRQHGNMISPLDVVHLTHILAPLTHRLVVLILINQKLLLLRIQIKLRIPLACLRLDSCVIVIPNLLLKRALMVVHHIHIVQYKLARIMLPQYPIRHRIKLVLSYLFQDIPCQLRILIIKFLFLPVFKQPTQILK